MASYSWPSGSGGGGGVSGVSSLNSLTGDLVLVGGSGITVTPSGSNITIAATGGGSGTVTSVALTTPSFLSVSGSPVTSAGTLAVSLATQTANTHFSGPVSGGVAVPTFRALVTADLPFSIGNLTDTGTDGLTVTGGTGSIIGSGVTLSQHVADSTHNGYLSSTDWSTFNGKQAALSFGNLTDAGTDGITITGGTGAVIGTGAAISQHVSDATHNGYLSSTDWSTFNGKGSGNGTVTSVTFTGDGTVLSSSPSSAVTTSGTLTAALNTQTANTILAGPATGSAAAPTFRALVSADLPASLNFVAPTVQHYVSGSGTYTTPTSPRAPLYLRIRALGGGGGGGGSGDNGGGTNGGVGGDTTFGSIITCTAGNGGSGSAGGPGGGGGTPTVTTGASVLLVGSVVGGSGGGSLAALNGAPANILAFSGAMGASSSFGGGGGGGAFANGSDAPANSGAGGGGAGGNENATNNSGGGGGAGGYAEVIITSPSSTYSYAVGTSGSPGANGANGFAGGAGGSGMLIVEEFYQ